MQKIVVANMKMQLTKYEIENYINNLEKFKSKNIKLIVCPSYLYINSFNASNYYIGAQNVFYESKGSYTGEISPIQLKDSFVKYVIIGHSERRKYFNETDDIINRKIKACLKEDLNIILCIGENIEQKNLKRTSIVIKKQLLNALKGIDKKYLKNIIIAYEPVYAIGTNNTLNIEDITSSVKYIKSIIRNNYQTDLDVIYGGSVNENNIKEILKCSDGVMIGKLCLSSEKFISILNTL